MNKDINLRRFEAKFAKVAEFSVNPSTFVNFIYTHCMKCQPHVHILS